MRGAEALEYTMELGQTNDSSWIYDINNNIRPVNMNGNLWLTWS